MSLRTRLTLLFTLLMGGVLLLSGVVVFINVNLLMVQNVDRDLKDTAGIMIADLQLDPNGKIELQALAAESPFEPYSFQVWGADGKLQISHPLVLTTALDEKGLTTQKILLESVETTDTHLRVLSQPIFMNQKVVGVIQVAANLSQLDDTQRMLAIVLLIATLVGMALTSVISWMATDAVLRPLESVAKTASRIGRVDDLSRRIPVKSDRKDEVSVLINVINQTLERLELLFSSQQRFLADVSHDLRTPLTVIKGNAELIRKTGRADAESLDSIDQEVHRLTHMVGDLLLLAQAESGKLPLEWRVLRLDELIEEVVKRMKPFGEEKSNLLLGGTSPTWVKGDTLRLKQVFENLISNALQHTPKGGRVTVEMTKTSKTVRVGITDTGPGISPQDLPHIFERFFRTAPSRPRGKEIGFGLGLSISDRIIKMHHGEISVKSELGVGTTFTVKLDVYQEDK